jgi:hypothetical protein
MKSFLPPFDAQVSSYLYSSILKLETSEPGKIGQGYGLEINRYFFCLSSFLTLVLSFSQPSFH